MQWLYRNQSEDIADEWGGYILTGIARDGVIAETIDHSGKDSGQMKREVMSFLQWVPLCHGGG